ncbi:hypothetical protein [Desulfovibrio oxyclinae]|uniref:hypothetical protein n=1 Tax=Desulfovibrio oxyclinae TaxID=63560 RepID=UPI00035EF067|nr:hypothetical protein [Desulfovibrio oxyclinae]
MGEYFLNDTELNEELESISRTIDTIAETKELPLRTLFPDEFVRQYTNYANIRELLDASGHDISCQGDLEACRPNGFDEFICLKTEFQNWDTMLEMAVCEWIKVKLG